MLVSQAVLQELAGPLLSGREQHVWSAGITEGRKEVSTLLDTCI